MTKLRGHRIQAKRTNGLDGKGGRVEEEEGDVQKVEERLDAGKHGRVLLETGEGDVDGTRTHSNRELARKVSFRAWQYEEEEKWGTYRLP